MLESHEGDDRPAYSVLIVCDRYLQRLNLALRSWLHAADGSTAEVLVANSNASDGVRNYVENLSASLPDRSIRLIALPEGATKLESQAALAGAARGAFLVFADSDMVFPPGFLTAVTRSTLTPMSFRWVPRRYASRDTTYQLIIGTSSLSDRSLYEWPHRDDPRITGTYDRSPGGYCHIYSTRAFEAIGGFDGLSPRGGKYGVYASLQFQRLVSAGIVDDVATIANVSALHLWHGEDDGKANIDGASICW